MRLHAVDEGVEDGGHVLVVSRDPHAEPPEPHYSQEELDALVGGGTVPPLVADSQATADALREAMKKGGSMELRLATGGGGLEAAKDHLLYFDSYDDVDVHRVMLADEARNKAYAAAIHKCRHFIQGKAVLDVGCGTGFLSLLCGRAGARVVYAVEGSAMAATARQVVEDNGLADVVQVLHSTVENVELPEQVDFIVSEWMGFYLLHESMLQSVLVARDRWLRPGGLMMPSRAHIHAAPVSLHAFRRSTIDFWDDVHGFNLTALKPRAWDAAMASPLVEVIDEQELLAPPQTLASLDLSTVTPQQLERIEHELHFTIARDGDFGGVCCWFDTPFDVPSSSPEEVIAPEVLCTGPQSTPTHWKQTTCLLGTFAAVKANEVVSVRMVMKQETNPRHYSLTLQT